MPRKAGRGVTVAVSAFPAPYARAPVNKWVVTLSVTFGTLMGAIDTSIVAVATPHLTGALGATVEEMTWVTTGFVIATVVVWAAVAWPIAGLMLRSLYGALSGRLVVRLRPAD